MKLNLEKINKINISLIGLMGSGKSIVAKSLSKKLKLRFYDSDKEIEKKTNKSISEIFQNNGEEYFREVEEKILEMLLNKKNSIISLGGGAILSQNTRNILLKKSFSIYLNVNNNILYERLKNSKKRPLLLNTDIEKTIIELKRKRIKYYKKANLIINNSEDIEKTIDKILINLKKL
tara:strand:+ start:1276 stop:1806 length:531 start_codon:yes stop_codon:yes gene_type:complete